MIGKGIVVFKTEWFDCFQATMFRNSFVREAKVGTLTLYNLCIQKKYFDRKSQSIKYAKVNCNKNEFVWLKMCLVDADKRARKKYW